MPLARLLLVLAHHPDLDNEASDNLDILKILAKYIDLYIECVVNRDNVGLLYHIAAKVKTVKGLAPNGERDEDNTVHCTS
jgi:sister-chromatid-cohesion protein PDS5